MTNTTKPTLSTQYLMTYYTIVEQILTVLFTPFFYYDITDINLADWQFFKYVFI